MSTNDEFERVEQLLRSAPAPAAVPSGMLDVAREAALGGPGARRSSQRKKPATAR